MIILNDVHIGFSRMTGTTPASREAMRQYLFQSFQSTIDSATNTHLVIAGDLFDDFDVPTADVLGTYMILRDWMRMKAVNRLTLIAGNHDWQPKASKVSSFELLGTVLKGEFAGRCVVVGIDQCARLNDGVWALAHCSNQEEFEAKLKFLAGEQANGFPGQMMLNKGDYLILHANFDNNFAAQSDHSLNVSREAARLFTDRGINLIFAHEHQAREVKLSDGEVIVMGNQWPTSISDCLNNDRKHYHTLQSGVILKYETWSHSYNGGFAEIGWRDLGTAVLPEVVKFVRVVGDAVSTESSEVISAIASFRSKSQVFVVSNAVKIDGIAQAEALPDSFEATKAFDVMDFISKHLDANQMKVVRTLAEVSQ